MRMVSVRRDCKAVSAFLQEEVASSNSVEVAVALYSLVEEEVGKNSLAMEVAASSSSAVKAVPSYS